MPRVQTIVVRGDRVLMVKHRQGEQEKYFQVKERM
jgi:hypothetical protein